MALTGKADHEALGHYRGLIYKTATLVVGTVEDDFEDVVQVLYIKAWYAIRHYDRGRSRMSRDRFVFMCLRNQVKDLQKKRRRGELSLEAMTEYVTDEGLQSGDRFHAKYLAAGHQDVYGEVEREPLVLPNTLSTQERQVVAMLASDYKQTEAASALGLGKRDMERLMRSIRTKLADWCPSPREPGELVALPARAVRELAVAA